MKRLLLFAVLLSISGSVSASTSFYLTDSSGNSEITLSPSNHVDLLFWYTGDPVISFDVEIHVTGPGTILCGIVGIPEWPLPPYLYYPIDGGVEAIGCSEDEDPLPMGISNPLTFIYFQCDGPGDVTLDLYDIATFAPTWDQIEPICHGMIIHQIPEPATMILLGLGGLLIRNKK
jgi:hypothetical protein